MKKFKIVAGAAQLGFNYFHKNKITQDRAFKLLDKFKKNKIKFIDTAPVYGKSEFFIGSYTSQKKSKFVLCSKLKKSFIKKNIKKTKNNIGLSIKNSLNRLKNSFISYYFIHDLNDLNAIVVKTLNKYKKKKIIKSIGASIYEIEDYKKCERLKKINSLQIPFNFLDHRFINLVKKNQKYEIFIRSVLLRGNINKDHIVLPSTQKFINLKEELEIFKKKYNFKNYFQLNFSFIKAFKNINYIIFGFENPRQVNIIKYFNQSIPMRTQALNELIEIIKRSNIKNDIDLRNWK